jgi:PAS domain S-box-containing protein
MMHTSVLDRDQPLGPDLIRLAPTTLWDDIGKSEHFVQFYEEDSCLVDSITDFFARGFTKGECAIVIATEAHRQALASGLKAGGFDLNRLHSSGHYIALDAAETLATLMVGDAPDPERFEAVIGKLIAEKSKCNNGIRAFGEMVALLCAEGNSGGAIALEDFWNELGKKHTFALFCAYPIKGFNNECDGEPFSHICKSHTRVIPTEKYSGKETSTDQRLRTITHLQQKAATLETEISLRKRCQESLIQRERELTDFLENATEGIHQVSAEGKLLWANSSEMELLGYNAQEYIGHHIAEFHADREVIEDILARLKRGEKLHDYEARLKHKDQSILHVSINSSGHWENGEFKYTRCFTRDITHRKRAAELLEELVAKRTAELRETVAELEAFSYSISHDMRSPLRAMQAYAISLLEDYRNRPLDEEGIDRLNRIQRGATRLDSLIRDVLAYSRVAKGEFNLHPISLETLVHDLIDQNLESQAKKCITVGKLHMVWGHEACLTQCLTNLIDNALKFVAPGTAPYIQIKSEARDGQVRVSISDNGIGIDPEHRERLFKIFGRIHSEKEYAGTGIGLAIVQKAVSRMGGEVGFQSEPDKGSTFWFTLRSGVDS